MTRIVYRLHCCLPDDECDQTVNVCNAESTIRLSKENLSRLTWRLEPISWSKKHAWRRNLPVANSSEPSFGDEKATYFLFDAGNMVLFNGIEW
jgi:hypothetical protein